MYIGFVFSCEIKNLLIFAYFLGFCHTGKDKISFLVFLQVIHMKLSSSCRYFLTLAFHLLNLKLTISCFLILCWVVTVYMVYFCAFACSEIFQQNARELGVGSRKFDAGVKGVIFHLSAMITGSIFLHCWIISNRVETLPEEMGLVASPFTVKSLLMRTLR